MSDLSWVADKQPTVPCDIGLDCRACWWMKPHTRPARAGDPIDAPCPDCEGDGENEDPYCGEPNCECRTADQTCSTCDGHGWLER